MTYAKHATPPFYHGTRADLAVGDMIHVGHGSNYLEDGKLSWVYFSATSALSGLRQNGHWPAVLRLGGACLFAALWYSKPQDAKK